MSRLILALDRMSKARALEIASQAKDSVWGFKVNDLLLHYGAEIVYELKKFGLVMADPKLHDIPNTNHNSIRILQSAGADIITIHAGARYAPAEDEASSLAGITILTSMNDEDCQEIYGDAVSSKVNSLAGFLVSKKYGYLVCSGQDLPNIPQGIKRICPGIRPQWHIKEDDQKRVVTPKQAIEWGADLVVIGRPIIEAQDLSEALSKTKEELGE